MSIGNAKPGVFLMPRGEEANGSDSAFHIRLLRTVHFLAIEVGAFACLGIESLPSHWVIDHTQYRSALYRKRNGYAKPRDAEGIISRAVQWINDPQVLGILASDMPFFAQEFVVGKHSSDGVDNDLLSLLIRLGGEVSRPFQMDLLWQTEMAQNDLPCFVRCFNGDCDGFHVGPFSFLNNSVLPLS